MEKDKQTHLKIKLEDALSPRAKEKLAEMVEHKPVTILGLANDVLRDISKLGLEIARRFPLPGKRLVTDLIRMVREEEKEIRKDDLAASKRHAA